MVSSPPATSVTRHPEKFRIPPPRQSSFHHLEAGLTAAPPPYDESALYPRLAAARADNGPSRHDHGAAWHGSATSIPLACRQHSVEYGSSVGERASELSFGQTSRSEALPGRVLVAQFGSSMSSHDSLDFRGKQNTFTRLLRSTKGRILAAVAIVAVILAISFITVGLKLRNNTPDESTTPLRYGVVHRNLDAHSNSITSIAVSPNNKEVYTAGGRDLTVRSWSVDTGETQLLRIPNVTQVFGLAMDPVDSAGRTLYINADYTVSRVNLPLTGSDNATMLSPVRGNVYSYGIYSSVMYYRSNTGEGIFDTMYEAPVGATQGNSSDTSGSIALGPGRGSHFRFSSQGSGLWVGLGTRFNVTIEAAVWRLGRVGTPLKLTFTPESLPPPDIPGGNATAEWVSIAFDSRRVFLLFSDTTIYSSPFDTAGARMKVFATAGAGFKFVTHHPLSLSPDGKWVFQCATTTGAETPIVLQWNAGTGELVGGYPDAGWPFALSADSRWLFAAARASNTSVTSVLQQWAVLT
ncbi:uncharacterized protein EV422DRAFT_542779 [Fimicolochytrium jonesii]|uniref:uncharacterized protein n=1 Tax=Fimicolochytrium jonesii TaxID=1396493 RepID=UPI0022FE2B76|nr:uncharacterized protein EV422DRAFT_542779 [Fimicolochytrium jonesii]KAI8817185.1 hypothetical protein EV422DRAFT_542779 [Fimicolochytrium jonesii]